MDKISLRKIVDELEEENLGGPKYRTYERAFLKFMQSCGKDPNSFKDEKDDYMLTKNEAIIYKEVIREVADDEGFLYKWLHNKQDKIKDEDIICFYQNVSESLKEKVNNNEIEWSIVKEFLETVDLSLGCNFTLLVSEIKSTFKSLMDISNTFLFPRQNEMLSKLLNEFKQFYDGIYEQGIETIIELTKMKISFGSNGSIEDYLEADGRYSNLTAMYVDRDERIREFLENNTKVKDQIEKVVGESSIERYYKMD